MRHTSEFLGIGQKIVLWREILCDNRQIIEKWLSDRKILEGIAQRIRVHDFARGHTVDLSGFLELFC
jgi:hypothetical protein